MMYRTSLKSKRHQLLLSKMLLILIALYFPVYSISLVSNVAGHQLLAVVTLLISCAVYARSRKSQFVIVLIASVLAVKFFHSGLYNLRYLAVSLVGWVIVSAVIIACERLRWQEYKRVRLFLWLYFIIVSVIVILQKFEQLPITLGGVTHEAKVVSTFSGVTDYSIRPNGYFYHPYDLAIFLSPYLFSVLISSPSSISKNTASLFLVSIIKLKSFMLWVVACLLLKFLPSRMNFRVWPVCLAILTVSFAATLVVISYADLALTAGRTVVWKIYLNDFLNSPVGSILWGLRSEQTSIALDFDAPPLTHNHLLFILCFGGLFFVAVFSFLLYDLLRLAKIKQNKPLTLYVVVIFLTLGLTGDLTMMMPFWIAASVLVMLLPRVRKELPTEHKQ